MSLRYRLSVPARINILGNPSDANEGDFATISAAVEVRAGALVASANAIDLSIDEGPLAAANIPRQTASYPPGNFPLPYDGQCDLLKGALNRLHAYSPEFRAVAARQGICIRAWSAVPRQSGLGGSSLYVLLALAGARLVYGLDPRLHNDYILAELTQRAESLELGIACGFADRYVPLLGGLAYIDYRGKLHHHPIQQEPYATYERLDPWIPHLPLVAITTGLQHDSGDVHGRMRPRYLAEHAAWQNGGGSPPPMVQFMSGAWETAWRGKIALLQSDWRTFGDLMNENHRLVDAMMQYCGFTDGAGWANNLCIQVALANGALGAKLTGAGGGGSVFALVPPGQEDRLARVWQETAAAHGLDQAVVFRPQIARQGLIVQADP